MLDNYKTHGKIYLIIKINFISSLDTAEFRTMYLKSDNAKIMMGFESDDIINKILESSLKHYQERIKTKMKGSNFVFKSVDLLKYHLHKISLNRGGSYIDSPDWIKHKRATINPKNEDDECFKYTEAIALNHEQFGNHPEKISSLFLINIMGK